jgi:hypothetical protein
VSERAGDAEAPNGQANRADAGQFAWNAYVSHEAHELVRKVVRDFVRERYAVADRREFFAGVGSIAEQVSREMRMSIRTAPSAAQ